MRWEFSVGPVGKFVFEQAVFDPAKDCGLWKDPLWKGIWIGGAGAQVVITDDEWLAIRERITDLRP